MVRARPAMAWILLRPGSPWVEGVEEGQVEGVGRHVGTEVEARRRDKGGSRDSGQHRPTRQGTLHGHKLAR